MIITVFIGNVCENQPQHVIRNIEKYCNRIEYTMENQLMLRFFQAGDLH